MLPFWIICTLSFANVENVVNPPQMPVVSNKQKVLSVLLYLLNNANIIPKKKHPNRFTTKVPYGKVWPYIFFMYVESKYLIAPPMKLPIPSASYFNSLFNFIDSFFYY